MFRRTVASLSAVAAVALGGAAFAAAPAMASGCTTAGCNLAAGDDNVAFVTPADTNGYSDAITNISDITDVSTFSYFTTSTGTISNEFPTPVDCTSAKTLQTDGAGVEAMITNSDSTGWDQAAAEAVINNATTRATFVSNVVSKITNTGCSNSFKFDGITLDFENLKATDRTGLSATVSALKTALHNASKVLFTSVFAKSTDNPSGFPTQQAEDYTSIGSNSDSVLIQMYGYCWESGCVANGPPGPAGPEFWVKANADYAATAISASKIDMILPAYGIDYAGSTGTDITFKADSATGNNAQGIKADAQDLISHYGGSSSFVTTGAGGTYDSSKYDYTVSGTSHEAWFADGTSVQDLITAVAQVSGGGLEGIGLWRLGGEDPAVWTSIENNW